jgi:hypothetical protein
VLFSTDKEGAPRPLTGSWDLGVFQHTTSSTQ